MIKLRSLGHGAPLASHKTSRPVTIFVDYPPVGGPNLVARRMPQFFSETFGQQFVVENIPGRRRVSSLQ